MMMYLVSHPRISRARATQSVATRCTVTWQVKEHEVTAVNSDVTYTHAPLLGPLIQAQRYYHNVARSQLFFKFLCM